MPDPRWRRLKQTYIGLETWRRQGSRFRLQAQRMHDEWHWSVIRYRALPGSRRKATELAASGIAYGFEEACAAAMMGAHAADSEAATADGILISPDQHATNLQPALHSSVGGEAKRATPEVPCRP